MSALPRRSFLSGLVGLPLIGGSVALVGRPLSAAVPVTNELLDRYIAFCHHEAAAAKIARWGHLFTANGQTLADYDEQREYLLGPSWDRYPDIDMLLRRQSAGARAAVVLSAAGVPLGGAA